MHCRNTSPLLGMWNPRLVVTPLVNILLWVKLDSNKWIFPPFNTRHVLQTLSVVVPGQSSPKLSHLKPRISLHHVFWVWLCDLEKLLGVRQCSWKLMVIFSSFISLITSGGACVGRCEGSCCDIPTLQHGRGCSAPPRGRTSRGRPRPESRSPSAVTGLRWTGQSTAQTHCKFPRQERSPLGHSPPWPSGRRVPPPQRSPQGQWEERHHRGEGGRWCHRRSYRGGQATLCMSDKNLSVVTFISTNDDGHHAGPSRHGPLHVAAGCSKVRELYQNRNPSKDVGMLCKSAGFSGAMPSNMCHTDICSICIEV